MSAGLGPVLLWLAGLTCAGVGLRVRAQGRATGPSPVASGIPLAFRAARRVPSPRPLVERLRRRADAGELMRAGLGGRLTADGLARIRAGFAVSGLVLVLSAALAGPPALAAAALLAALGVASPGRWVARRRRIRRRALVRELPDLLDLLGICVESGMALDPALRLSADRLGGTLGEEVSVALRDLSLGSPRRVAYRDLVERAGSPEMARAVGALLQAEELGAPLSRALQGQAEALRAGRRQEARESAARAAPKIQLVVAMVMVPAVLLLVLGVLVIELARQVGAVAG